MAKDNELKRTKISRGPTNPNRPGGIKLGSSRINPNSPGGVLRMPPSRGPRRKARTGPLTPAEKQELLRPTKPMLRPKRNITQSKSPMLTLPKPPRRIPKLPELMPERQKKVPNKKYGPKPTSPSPSMRHILSPEEIRMLNFYRKKNKKKNKKL